MYLFYSIILTLNIVYLYEILFFVGSAVGEDLVQSNNAPSSRTPRGHQFPMAFMMLAAGVDKVSIYIFFQLVNT